MTEAFLYIPLQLANSTKDELEAEIVTKEYLKDEAIRLCWKDNDIGAYPFAGSVEVGPWEDPVKRLERAAIALKAAAFCEAEFCGSPVRTWITLISVNSRNMTYGYLNYCQQFTLIDFGALLVTVALD